jgi:hypothetical protein
VTNTSGLDAFVCAWLDTANPASGPFDGSDLPTNGTLCRTVSSGGASNVVFEWTSLLDEAGTTFARFRVCTTQSDCDGSADAQRNQAASNGEVEGYTIAYDFNPTAVTIGSVTLHSLAVTDFLNQLSVEQMSNDQLLAIIAIWDPLTAATMELTDDAATLIAALKHFLDPDGDGQVAELHWDTLEERGTVGFYVERAVADGGWVLINKEMLPAMVFAPLGAEYKLVDPSAKGGRIYQYRLIEQEAKGNTREYGPFELELN